MISRPVLALVFLAALVPAIAHAAAISTAPVVSDLRATSFSVSWVSASPSIGWADVQIGGKWVRFPDVRGNVKTTAHLISPPCGVQVQGCKYALTPNTTYNLKLSSGRALKVRTTPPLSPFGVPISVIAGNVQDSAHHALTGALVYVQVRRGNLTSYPLATLTVGGGKWAVALANAVTPQGKVFPLTKGDAVTIQVITAHGRSTTSTTLSVTDRPIMMSKPIIVR